MKIAIVHDYIKEYGGAERVLEALHEVFPDAPVFTSVYLPEFLGPHAKRFKGWDIRTSFFQHVPLNAKLISPFRLIAPWVFSLFDFSEFDVIIVSATGAYAPNMIKKKSALQICYCHTPPHYLYGYMTARDWEKNPIMKVFGEIANHFLRLVDFKSAQNVDYFIANSEEVASRIKKFYRRDATVIYPPVEVKKIPYNLQPKTYYLTGGRLARAKGVDIILEAFRRNGKQLKVFGRGFGDYDEISNFQYPISNIQYLGEVSDEEKFELMRNAKAFVFASFDEDFGITPVEAMGVGTPVIAYNSGGVKETVVDPSTGSGQVQTGVLYNKNTPEELNKAVERFEKLSISPEVCKAQAAKFNKQRFLEKIKQVITSKVG